MKPKFVELRRSGPKASFEEGGSAARDVWSAKRSRLLLEARCCVPWYESYNPNVNQLCGYAMSTAIGIYFTQRVLKTYLLFRNYN